MIRYLLRRLAISIGVLFGVTLGLFVLLQVTPGDPTDVMFDPLTFEGDREAAVAAARDELGLNQPILVQYFAWLRQLLSGNLGVSYTTHQPVAEMMADRIPPTVLLMVSAMSIALLVGVMAGIWSALRRNQLSDYVISAVSLVGASVPGFFVALLGIYVLALKLPILPSAGMNDPSGGVGDLLVHLIMPATILGLPMTAGYIRWTRSSMLDVLGSDYLVTARAKGISESAVVVRHALRNALIPLVTIIAMAIPNLVGGAVVIEQIFAWPGMGRLAVDAINGRDYPVVLGFVFLTAVLVVLFNMLADLLYAVIDPRIRVT